MEGSLTASGQTQRQRHNANDTSPTTDATMKHGQMSPTALPTTPSKGASRGETPEPSMPVPSDKHSKRDAYKAQKRTYRSQKKEAAKELLSTITDPAVVLLGDWLKVRGTLKSWTKLWCVLKPGLLILYKSDKHKGSQWVGTILLNTCQLLERPSKKDGFCFKLFHPLDQSIWATKGPKGETIGAFVQPLPYSYCIFRAPSESAGKCWMDALELALKCTSLLKRSMTRLDSASDTTVDYHPRHSLTQTGGSWAAGNGGEEEHGGQNSTSNDHGDDAFTHSYNSMRAQEGSMDDSDLERHFANQDVDGVSKARENVKQHRGRGRSSPVHGDRGPKDSLLCPKCRKCNPELLQYNYDQRSPDDAINHGKKSSDRIVSKIPINSDRLGSKKTRVSSEISLKQQRIGDGSGWNGQSFSEDCGHQGKVTNSAAGERSSSVGHVFHLKGPIASIQKSSGMGEIPSQKCSDTSERISRKSSLFSERTHQKSPLTRDLMALKHNSPQEVGSYYSPSPQRPQSAQSLPVFRETKDRSISVPYSSVTSPVVHAVTFAPEQMLWEGKGENNGPGFAGKNVHCGPFGLSASQLEKMPVKTAPVVEGKEASQAISPSSPINLPVNMHQPLNSDESFKTSAGLDRLPGTRGSISNRLPGRGSPTFNMHQPFRSDEPYQTSAGVGKLSERGSPIYDTYDGYPYAEAMPHVASFLSQQGVPQKPSDVKYFEKLLQNRRHQLKKVSNAKATYEEMMKDNEPMQTSLHSELTAGKSVSPSVGSSCTLSSHSLSPQNLSWKGKPMYSVNSGKHWMFSGSQLPQVDVSCTPSTRSSALGGDSSPQEWQAREEGKVRQKILKFSQPAKENPGPVQCSCLKDHSHRHSVNRSFTVDQGTQTGEQGTPQYSHGGDTKKSVQLASVLKKTDFSPSPPFPIMQDMLYTIGDSESDSQSVYTTVSTTDSQSSQSVTSETGSDVSSKSGTSVSHSSKGKKNPTKSASTTSAESSSSSGSERSDSPSKASHQKGKKAEKKKKVSGKDTSRRTVSSQTSLSGTTHSVSVDVSQLSTASRQASSVDVEPSESMTSTDYNESAGESQSSRSSSPSRTRIRTTHPQRVHPRSAFSGNSSFSNSSRLHRKREMSAKESGKGTAHKTLRKKHGKSDSKKGKKSKSHKEGGEGGGKKKKKKSKDKSADGSKSEEKVAGEEGDKKKKKKKKHEGAEGEKAGADESGHEGDKKKKKKKKHHEEGAEGEKSGDESGHEGDKKKKKKKKHHEEGAEGEKSADESGHEGDKKKKKKKKHHEEGAEGEKSADESGHEGGKKKKKKKKHHEEGAEGEKSADESGHEGDKKKKKKKKHHEEGAEGEKSADESGHEGGKKKKKKKKHHEEGAEGEKSGDESGHEGDKKKKKKKKHHEEGAEGEKSADESGHEGDKKKKKKKKHHEEGAEGEKSADESGHEGDKKKKKKKKHHEEGAEGEKSADESGHEGGKKKKKKKKHHEEGAEGEKSADESGHEGGKKKKKKKKHHEEGAEGEKAGETGEEGGEKKGEGTGEKEKADHAESEGEGGKKKKKKKKKKEGEGETPGDGDEKGHHKKKKKKKKKHEGETEGGEEKKTHEESKEEKGDASESTEEGHHKKKKKKKKKKTKKHGGEESGHGEDNKVTPETPAEGEEKKTQEEKAEAESGHGEGDKVTPEAPTKSTSKEMGLEPGTSSAPDTGTAGLELGTSSAPDTGTAGLESHTSSAPDTGTAGLESHTSSAPDTGTAGLEPGTSSAPDTGTAEASAVQAAPVDLTSETSGSAVTSGAQPSGSSLVTTEVAPSSAETGSTSSLPSAGAAPSSAEQHVDSKSSVDIGKKGLAASGGLPVSQTSEEEVSATSASSRVSSPAVHMEQITSTSENDDIVFDMPLFLQKVDAWADEHAPKVDHFKSVSELSQLCPKCVEALRHQGLTDKLFGSEDSASANGSPVFVSQKFKMLPMDDAHYASSGKGMAGADASHQAGSNTGMGAAGRENMPSLDELHYAVANVQLKKLITQRQKLELEKSNLRLDLLVKEEHLDKEYGQGLDEDKSEQEDTESSQSEFEEDVRPGRDVLDPPEETNYLVNKQEELGQRGDECQTEEVNEENKGLIWTLVKQVRPGMDLSKVVLPTFILEPRSFLDKLSDYYYHADILSGAVLEESPYSRIKSVVKWYLSGFYKKPKGLKKPYNPVIGEVFRCCWHHPATGSRTFYIAEQVSHHPPVSVFHVTNRKDGFNISGSILARSKFYGNSLSAFLDGVATLSFLERGEDYFITMPYAHCKGILIGTLTMELGGKVTIDCPKTGYKCELEFKLKPFLGSGQASNRVHGKILMGADLLASIDGHWDQDIYIKDRALDKKREVFWDPTPEVRSRRLRRCTVPLTDQCPYESERLWERVSKAVTTSDMQAATNEKYIIEEEQRKNTRDRKLNKTEWVPRYFEKDFLSGGDWIYRHADDRPWDPVNDVYQYEKHFVIQTQTRHKTPHLRANSINSVNKNVEKKKLHLPLCVEESDSSGHGLHRESDSSDYRVSRGCAGGKPMKMTQENMTQLLLPLVRTQQETGKALRSLQQHMARLDRQLSGGAGEEHGQDFLTTNWLTLAVVLILQVFLQWVFR